MFNVYEHAISKYEFLNIYEFNDLNEVVNFSEVSKFISCISRALILGFGKRYWDCWDTYYWHLKVK